LKVAITFFTEHISLALVATFTPLLGLSDVVLTFNAGRQNSRGSGAVHWREARGGVRILVHLFLSGVGQCRRAYI